MWPGRRAASFSCVQHRVPVVVLAAPGGSRRFLSWASSATWKSCWGRDAYLVVIFVYFSLKRRGRALDAMPVRLSEQRRKAIARSLVRAASSADSFSISSIDQLLFRVGACGLSSPPRFLPSRRPDPPVSRFVLPFVAPLASTRRCHSTTGVYCREPKYACVSRS